MPDTLFYQVAGDIRSGNFYQRLRDRWYQKKLTKGLFNLLFSLPSEDFKLDTTHLIKSEGPFDIHQGKVIGDIWLNKLQPLGTSMENPAKRPVSVIQKLGNGLNFNTNKKAILNNLLFTKGDTVNASLLSDNERIIRSLPFIKDARIIIKERSPQSDTIDVELITKEVLSLSVDLEARDFDAGLLRIDHRNIFGLGHEVDNKFSLDNDADQYFSYQVKYRIPNLFKTFTSLEIGYANTENRDFTRFRINRDFITPQTKFAGGFEWSQEKIREVQFQNIISDLEFDEISTIRKYDYQDVWLARAFKLKFKDPVVSERSRIILSGRLTRTDYISRPEVSESLNKADHNRFLAIGSLGFSQRRYFKDQLIFGYGRTEDIPYGASIEFLGGYDWGEFYNRSYAGFRVSKGSLVKNFGYLYGNAQLEGYLYQKKWEQAVFKTDFRYISSLIDFNRWKLRQFITINYTRGIDRFESEFIDIRDKNGIRGLTSHTLRGTQRFLMNIETVCFTPFELLNFKLALFSFFDIGLINSGERNIFKGKEQQGMGLGVRIRNDNLTFKAIEIRFAYYPEAPVGIESSDIDLSGNSGFAFSDFLINRPEINIFR